MKLNTDSFVGVGICILGLLGVGYAIGVHSKMKTVCEKLDTSAVKRATDEVMDDVKREIESRVGAVVKEHYDAISDGVTDQIAEKFDDKLDDILEEFNGNLQNVGKIYKSIAKSFSKEDI